MQKRMLQIVLVLSLGFSLWIFGGFTFFQAEPPPPFDIGQVLVLLSPIVVWIVTGVVKAIKPNLTGLAVLIIVGVLNLGYDLVVQFTTSPAISFWAQFGMGFLAVTIKEITKQISQANTFGYSLTKPPGVK